MNKNNPFSVEEYRMRLAKNKQHKALLATYSQFYAEIPNLNTPGLWDKINTARVKDKNPMDEHRIRVVNSYIHGTRILNVGFGSASLEKKYFASHRHMTFEWSGIDISPASVKKARKEFPKGTFMLGDITSLPHKDNIFDTVISLEVLEHISPRNTFKALKEINRVIKPGGYGVISVPTNEGLEQMVAKKYNPNAHVRTYTQEVIQAELTMSGFEIIKTKKLYAFHNFHNVKSFVAAYSMSNVFHVNNIITLVRKPK